MCAEQSQDAGPSHRAGISRLKALHLGGAPSVAHPMVSGSELVAMSLRSLGIAWIAGVEGSPVRGIYRACAKEGLRLLITRSQSGASLMTAASAFVAGRPSGAVVLSAGPAVTNAMTGMLVAHDNHWPLLMLGGRRSLGDAGRGHFQEIDTAALVRPIAKWSSCVRDVAEIPRLIQDALCIAQSDQPGPVYLDLPEDILETLTPSQDVVAPRPPTWINPTIDQLERVAARIHDARNPVLVVGEGARWRLDPGEIRSWLEHLRMPVVPLPLMRGVVTDTHSWVSADARSRALALAQADLVLILGADLDWRLRFGAELHPRASVIQIRESASPTLHWEERIDVIQAEPGLFLNGLRQQLAMVPRLQLAPTHGGETATRSLPCTSGTSTTRDRLSLNEIFEVVHDTLPPEAFLVLDGKLTLEAGQLFLPRQHPFLHLDPGWNGCMGSGIPFAMAARLHHPNRPVLLVTGDFAFGLGAIELETVARLDLALVVLIVNNDGPSGGRNQSELLPQGHPETSHRYQAGLGYENVATGLGMAATRATTSLELRAALQAALEESQPHLINALTDPMSTPCGHP